MDEKLKGSNPKLLNDQWHCTDYRDQDLLRAAPIVGTPACAEWMVSVVISCEKSATFIKHVGYTRLGEEINNGTQSKY